MLSARMQENMLAQNINGVGYMETNMNTKQLRQSTTNLSRCHYITSLWSFYVPRSDGPMRRCDLRF